MSGAWVVAVATGNFSLPQAAGTFSLIVVGEIFYGIVVGWLSLRLRRWAHRRPYRSTAHRVAAVPAYLMEYNYHRPHGGLGGA